MFADDRAPGDLGFDPLGCGKDPQAFARRQLVEVKNGRLAMIAFGGMIHQQLLTKQGVIEQVNCVSLLALFFLLPACLNVCSRSLLHVCVFFSSSQVRRCQIFEPPPPLFFSHGYAPGADSPLLSFVLLTHLLQQSNGSVH